MAGVLAITFGVFWSSASIIQQNFELQQKVAEIESENRIIELENQNKALQNAYLETDEFAEITARRINGKAANGERIYILPKEVALGALRDSGNDEAEQPAVAEVKAQWQQNLEAWLSVYFGN